MNSSLQKKFESLESQRKTLLHSLQNLSAEKLNHQPEGKWSINQVIAHLIAAEKLSLVYLTKKIQAINEVENTGVVEELKMIALIISQRLPLKFKAPRMVVENTSHSQELSKLEQEWTSLRQELKLLLENFSDDQINRKIYKHIRAGKLNIQHALIFFREHIIHHQRQLNHLL